MKETHGNPHIRVDEHTRKRLKIMAAQKEMSMQDLVEWLLSEQEKREETGKAWTVPSEDAPLRSPRL